MHVAVRCSRGLPHGHVGAPQQRRYVVAVIRVQGDARGRVELHGDPVDHMWTGAASCANASCVLDGVVGRRDAGNKQRELVAPEANECDLVVNDLPQSSGDFDEYRVAARMAERVVDFLEAVEVDEQQRRLHAGVGPREKFGTAVDEVAAVSGRSVSWSCSAWCSRRSRFGLERGRRSRPFSSAMLVYRPSALVAVARRRRRRCRRRPAGRAAIRRRRCRRSPSSGAATMSAQSY